MKKNKMNFDNPIYGELINLGLISSQNIKKISEHTRDSDVSVYKDAVQGIIFLEKYKTNTDYYLQKKYKYKNKNLISKEENESIYIDTNNGGYNLKPLQDDERRYRSFRHLFENKKLLDYGCGWGGFLSLFGSSENLHGLEIKPECLEVLEKNLKHIPIKQEIIDFEHKFDVITMFHVLEHMPNQVEVLRNIKDNLEPGGKLIIEVPSANDFLFKFENLKSYRDFTFFSEHLILHTYKSLKRFLEVAGFKHIEINFFQRYGLNNHLGWFVENKPGGHTFFETYTDEKIDEEYKKFLCRNKTTDTLIAIAS